MACLHEMRDMDSHYIISPENNMAITNANSVKNSLNLGDHDSEIFTFEVPKHIDGHDMSLCNVVRVHYINTSTDKTEVSKDAYRIKDMQEAEDDVEKLLFTWKISGNATNYAGNLAFRIEFTCVDENNVVLYKKWTKVFKDVHIDDGFDNAPTIVEEFSDILEEWKNELESLQTAEAISSAVEKYMEENPVEVPDKLPNPNALTFTGAVTGSYDGSKPLSVEIPSGGSGGSSEWIIVEDKVLENDIGSIEYSNLDCYDLRIGIEGRYNNSDDSLSNANATATILVNETGNGYHYDGHIGYIRGNGSSFPTVIEIKSFLVAPSLDLRILPSANSSDYKNTSTAFVNGRKGKWTTEKINTIVITPKECLLKKGTRIVVMKRS